MQNLRPTVLLVPVCAALTAGACNLGPGETTETSQTASDSDDGTTSDTGGTTAAPTTDDTPTTDAPDTTGEPTTGTPDATTDEPETGPGTTEGGEAVTIYQIQQGEIAENTVVTLKGVIVTSSMQMEQGALFVQEADGGEWSGIYLYLYDEVAAAFEAKPGLVVDITGEYVEFNGNSQLKVVNPGDIVVVDEGEVPAPAVVAPADVATGGAKAENWESVLVRVENVTVDDPGIDIGEFSVDDGLRISDFFLFELGMDVDPAPGQVFTSITGPLLFSFDNFKVAPRTPADLVSEGVDPTETTIYDIQQGMVTLGSVVEIKGAVVTSPLTFKKDGFFIQDPAGGEFSGIYVYVGANAVDVKVGDVVDVAGEYDEYFEFSQIKVADAANVMVTGSGEPLDPVLVDAADVAAGGPMQEAYEGVLVTVEAVTVAAVNMMYGEYELDSGLFVDDLFFAKADWTLPKAGDTFTSLTGPLAFSFDEAKLSPRTAADITP